MIIRVLDQNYFVQHTLPSEQGLVQYVCTNVSEDDGRYYRIVRIPVREVDTDLVGYLADIYKEGLFHELVQYGNEKDQFHVIVDCGPIKGRTLNDRLTEDVISLAERLTMGDNLLKYLIISSIPLWFAESSMDTDHILFTDAVECAFDFELEFLEHFKEAVERNMQMRLSDVLYAIFAKELDKDKLPEMGEFLERIQQGEYSDLMSIYQTYRGIELQYAAVNEALLEPKNLLWKIWDKIKLLASHAERYFGVVVFIIAIAYLVWSIWNLKQPTKQKDIYPAIGDEVILSRIGTEAGATDSSISTESSEESTVSENDLAGKIKEGMEAGQ